MLASPASTTRPDEAASGDVHPCLRFAPPGHYYSPLPDLAEVERRATSLFPSGIVELPGIDLREAEQLRALEQCEAFYREQPFPIQQSPGHRYRFENPAYSYSDALFYYFVLRLFRPRRVVEVGSGHSTCVALDTSDAFLGGALRMTCIEPYPELVQSLMRPEDRARVTLRPEGLQETPLSVFQALEPNDVLFIDSTHVSRIGSDVNRLLFEILPRLPPGVLIHFHDVFYPFEYPREWLREGRAWNEAYLLRGFLQFNRAFEIVFFNTFLSRRHRQRFEERFPLCLRNEGGSIWLRKIA